MAGLSAVPPSTHESTVLVVDDTPANLGVMVEYLEAEGLRVLIAQDGEEGLRRAERVRPDIILLDVMMPKMDGFEVCRRLKGIAGLRETPVIFLTALSEPREKILGFEVGGIDYLTKPIEIHELRARVTTHLRLHAMQKHLEQQVAARTAELNQRNEQLRAEVANRERLQRAFLAATDHEQRHLAQELHDGLGQDLVGLDMLLHVAMNEVKAGRLPRAAEMERMVSVVRNAHKACHDIAHGLSPLTGTAGGLAEALSALKARLSGPPGPVLELRLDHGATGALTGETSDELYRIAQEATSNAIKHAGATRVVIGLSIHGETLRLDVADDGGGIKEQRPGLGLHTMNDRAVSIGGTLRLSTRPGGGTLVSCEVPSSSDGQPAGASRRVADDAGGAPGSRSEQRARTAEAERDAALQEVVALSRARTHFLSGIGHELRTPLNAILGFAQILEGGQLTEQQRFGVSSIKSGGQHLLALVDDLLELARIDAGKLELNPTATNLDAFIGFVADNIRAEVEQKGLALKLEVSPTLPAYVHVDAERMRRVLVRLLDNAVEYTDSGWVALRVSAVAGGDEANITLRFEVEDSGTGMTDEELAAVFAPFGRSTDMSRSAGGSGVGLAVSRQLVQSMGGELRARSERGRGSQFSFELVVPVGAVFRPRDPLFEPGAAVPPAEEIAILHGLALAGSMREVLERARWIENLDPRYAPFARELAGFAQAYQSQALLRFVARFQQSR